VLAATAATVLQVAAEPQVEVMLVAAVTQELSQLWAAMQVHL
jgi:hypothetical protein